MHEDEIEQQQQLLATYRRTLTHLLLQHAQFTAGHIPAHIANSIVEARANIQRIKETLRGWGVAVDDHPDDVTATTAVTALLSSQLPTRRGKSWLWAIIGGGAVLLVLLLVRIVAPRISGELNDATRTQQGDMNGRQAEALSQTAVTSGQPAAALPTGTANTGRSTIVPSRQCPLALTFGQTIECALESNSEFDSYTFEAKANDVVKIRADAAQAALRVTVTDPQHKKVEACTFVNSCTLPIDGTYTLQVEVSVATGSAPFEYSLYTDRVNTPVNVQAIQLGQTYAGALDLIGNKRAGRTIPMFVSS
jgi:hypothetical protein